MNFDGPQITERTDSCRCGRLKALGSRRCFRCSRAARPEIDRVFADLEEAIAEQDKQEAEKKRVEKARRPTERKEGRPTAAKRILESLETDGPATTFELAERLDLNHRHVHDLFVVFRREGLVEQVGTTSMTVFSARSGKQERQVKLWAARI